jgi:hypothetical protein
LNRFRDTECYKIIIDCLLINQNQLCAYCECKIINNNKQIELFILKSLTTDKLDYIFGFSKLFICYKGGSNISKNNLITSKYIKNNLSCGQKKGSTNPEGRCLNPYELPDFSIFKLYLTNESNILLVPDEDKCRDAKIDINLVFSTIEILGLNYDRLSKKRYKNYKQFFTKISEYYYIDRCQEFYTSIILTLRL